MTKQINDIKEEVSKILIKYNMPTRQAAINEIITMVTNQALSSVQQLPEMQEEDIPFTEQKVDVIGAQIALNLLRSQLNQAIEKIKRG